MEGDEIFFKGGKFFSNCGAFEGLLLGLKTDSDFALDARLHAIMVEVTIARLEFFLFGRGEGVTTLGSTVARIFSTFSEERSLDASFVDEQGEGRILGSISFSLYNASRRIEEEHTC